MRNWFALAEDVMSCSIGSLALPLAVILTAGVACQAGTGGDNAAAPTAGRTAPVLDQTVTSLAGDAVDLGDYRGKVLLVVNTASKCGYTPQYAGLEELYQRFKDRGLVVIGFPSNDFGHQEPGTAEDIRTFCSRNYGVTFPMMAKVHTKGPEQSPVYAMLTAASPPDLRGEIKWNFTKFLVDRDGHPIARFESAVEPLSPEVVAAVEKALGG